MNDSVRILLTKKKFQRCTFYFNNIANNHKTAQKMQVKNKKTRELWISVYVYLKSMKLVYHLLFPKLSCYLVLCFFSQIFLLHTKCSLCQTNLMQKFVSKLLHANHMMMMLTPLDHHLFFYIK